MEVKKSKGGTTTSVLRILQQLSLEKIGVLKALEKIMKIMRKERGKV